jgi:protein-S-isoprenylcysteine O-methyltransferase Ste14
MTIPRSSASSSGVIGFAWLLLMLLAMAAMLFCSAGTWRYWEAWTYLGILLTASSLIITDLLKYSPALLERRLRMREKESRQRWIVGSAWLWFVATHVTAGLDQRFGGSEISALAVGIADAFVILGYGVTFWVFRVNPYASRIIEVEPGQRVISTGPYAVVRHPMYSGGLLIHLAAPLALGSYWALLPAVFILPLLVARLRHEESVLLRDLAGYREYTRQTRHRLVPGIW